ncbi:MAG: hypothetical protein IJA20_10985 [Methanocorpusculum sp.]|nr:hypothetical protein [Oscillospiraceae bacterium]MBQ3571179.1 hypothetical protein [Methanocorpusculum sp.]
MMLDRKLLGAIATFIVVFLFANILVFLIPFPHGIAFWTAYVFLMIALVIGFVITYVSAEKTFTQKNGIRYYPLMRFGVMYLIVQGIVSLIFFLLDSYITLPLIWIPPVVCLVIFAIFAVLLISTYSGLKVVESVDEQSKKETAFIYSLTAEAELLAKQVSDADLQKELTSLYEAIRYSDPVSTLEVADVNSRIRDEMDVLKAAVTLNDAGKIHESVQNLSLLIAERNQKCKLVK